MKVFNISDTESFFEVLSECAGEVQVIGKDGTGVSITPDSDGMKILKNTYRGGMIKEIELKVKDAGDILKMVDFMVSMDHAA